MITILLSSAFADALTDGPGTLHGNIGIRTSISSASDKLIEEGEVVGNRSYRQTNVTLYGEFSPIKHVSVAFELPYFNENYRFTNITTMSFSPEKKVTRLRQTLFVT